MQVLVGVSGQGRKEKERKKKTCVFPPLFLSAEVSTILPFVAYVRDILHRGNASCVGEDRFITVDKRCTRVEFIHCSHDCHGICTEGGK